MDEDFNMTSQERVQYLQYRVLDYWNKKSGQNHKEVSEGETASLPLEIPSRWSLTKKVTLYSWQEEALGAFPGKGIAKVVTGAGKTIFALALIEKLQREKKDLKVLIVVPTIVLLEQWYETIRNHTNLPQEAIGRLGGGYGDDLAGCEILIGVVNSVVLHTDEWQSLYKERLFLIADECHRYRGEVMRRIFSIERRFSLGLSATPDVEYSSFDPEDNEENEFAPQELPSNEELLEKELGKIFFTLNYDDAVKAGFLPEFEIRHIGLPLKPHEEMEYRKLSDEITRLRDNLLEVFPGAPRGGALSGWAAYKLNSGKIPEDLKGICAAYIAKTSERKSLLYRAENRTTALMRTVQEYLKRSRKTRIILFHERIDEVMHLFNLLRKNRVPVSVEHSQLPDSDRKMSIDLFRSGDARVIVSGKALIEGFDAPAADIGINVASSGSRTKAIQSIGRVLRKNSKDGDKLGLIIRFYISNTIDALTYKKCDFSQITGARRNRYFLWDPEDADMGMEDQEQSAPPYSPLPKEEALDWENVRPGDRLFFEADGEDYQLDPAGNVYKKSESRQKKYIVNAQNVTQILAPFMEDMRNNYFRQSSTGRIFLRQYDSENDLWSWMYCGKVEELFLPEKTSAPGTAEKVEEFRIKQFRGRQIIQQARPVNNVAANIPEKYASMIFEGIAALDGALQNPLRQLYIADGVEVYCLLENKKYPLCTLPEKWNL